jgi:hypothetical protein
MVVVLESTLLEPHLNLQNYLKLNPPPLTQLKLNALSLKNLSSRILSMIF